jgi:plasmid stabilization system protein ParE
VKVYFSPRALHRASIVMAWWRKNRDAADLFERELEQAKRALEDPLELGLVYETIRGKVIYRMLLGKSVQHIYYSVDEKAGIVIVHTIWGARRGRGPQL